MEPANLASCYVHLISQHQGSVKGEPIYISIYILWELEY